MHIAFNYSKRIHQERKEDSGEVGTEFPESGACIC